MDAYTQYGLKLLDEAKNLKKKQGNATSQHEINEIQGAMTELLTVIIAYNQCSDEHEIVFDGLSRSITLLYNGDVVKTVFFGWRDGE